MNPIIQPSSNANEFTIVWEAPKLVPPEFRLYYDDSGKVLFYTCDKIDDGNYIVIDAVTYAAARPDIRVIDGRISTVQPNAVVCKLMPNKDEGQTCVADDISIIATADYTDATIRWKLVSYEL